MSKLFSEITDFTNIHKAYVDARRNKRFRLGILEYGCNLEKNLLSIKRDMKNRTYVHGGYREFIITDSKKRTINAAPFRDRVVHHMICNIIEPILDRTFIYDSYACRKGKGTHRAFKKLEKNLRSIKAKIPERERA